MITRDIQKRADCKLCKMLYLTIMDISKNKVLGKTLLSWNQEKQDAAIVRLWKEFNLYQFYDDAMEERCKKLTDKDYKLLVNDFKVDKHFVRTLSHKKFILKTFSRFQTYFESINLKLEQLERHDDSKLTNFLEIIGYTQRWIWNNKDDIWKDASKHHHMVN